MNGVVVLPIMVTLVGLKAADRFDPRTYVHPQLDLRNYVDGRVWPIVLLGFSEILTVAYGAILAALIVAEA